MPASDAAALRVKGVRRGLLGGDDKKQLVADYSAEEEAQRLELAPDEPDCPGEKPANYSKLLAHVQHDMDWYGKHNMKSPDRAQMLGRDMAGKIEEHLRALSADLDKPTHQSFANRAHALTVMQLMIDAATTSDGSGVASDCREDSCDYDVIFVAAVQKLTEGQRRRFKVLDRGTWVQDLCDLIQERDDYCKWPGLRKALAVIDPEAADRIPMKESLAKFYAYENGL